MKRLIGIVVVAIILAACWATPGQAVLLTQQSGTATSASKPSATSTVTLSPTQAPTATVDLAGEGYDIAGVQVSYPREDMIVVDLHYRLPEEEEIGGAIIVSTIPALCLQLNSNDRYYAVSQGQVYEQTIGTAHFEFKQPLEGECSSDALVFKIWPLGKGEDRWAFLEDGVAYEEEFDIAFRILRDYPALDSDTIIVRSFDFETTGDWTGKYTFEYIIDKQIPLDLEQYYFALTGWSVECQFYAEGPLVTDHEGFYVVEVDLREHLSSTDCIEGYSSYTFGELFFNAKDILAQETVYFHAMEFQSIFLSED